MVDALTLMGISKREHDAWLKMCANFKETVGDINNQKYDFLVALIQVWGEELVQLRLAQEPAIVTKAALEAREKVKRHEEYHSG